MSRLILFDIDETMIHSSGTGRRALERSLSDSFGREISLDGHILSGKTDPQIIREVLESQGFSDIEIQTCLENIYELYIPILKEEVLGATEFRVHNGVFELLAVLHEDKNAYLGLLTGNIERGARVKLNPANLNRYFDFGAFGCDSADRLQLPAIAHERAKKHFGMEFSNRDIVIIGDARGDVLCAKGYGARSLAVCTGKTTKEALVELQPDFIFDDLKDTGQVIEAIFAI